MSTIKNILQKNDFTDYIFINDSDVLALSKIGRFEAKKYSLYLLKFSGNCITSPDFDINNETVLLTFGRKEYNEISLYWTNIKAHNFNNKFNQIPQ